MIGNWLRTARNVLGVGILSRAVFSIFLAFLLWGWVTNLDDPEVDRTFANLPVTMVGRAPDLVVLDEASLPPVSAVVRGPQSALEALRPESLRATVNLADLRDPGAKTLDVEVEPVNDLRGVRVASANPRRITLSLDRLATKTFPLEADRGAAVPPYSIGNIDYQTRQVEVHGPASLLGRVARVTLPVALGDRRETFEAQFTPEARDANGNRVTGVTISPASITATVAVERIGRTVSIVPNISGILPDGYLVRDTSVSPPSITVDGPVDVLSQLIVVSTTPISVNGRRESFSVYDVPLALPPGTRQVERTAINVEIRIEAEQQRQQVNVRVGKVNADPTLTTTITPQEIIVVLSGARERLGQLRSDDVKAEVDLRGLGVGAYVLPVRLTVPPDLRADTPPTVRVQIDRPATPTARPTPTPIPPPTPTPAPPPPSAAPPSGRADDRPIARLRAG